MFRVYKNANDLVILLPKQAYTKIRAHVKRYYPNECGGVLVGKIISDENTAVIEETITLKKFRSTPLHFLRLAASVNKRLVRLFQRSGGESYYLGEWHSHPNARPTPSLTDWKAMMRISVSQSSRIATPLLLIVSYDSKHFDERFYILLNQKLIGYVKQD